MGSLGPEPGGHSIGDASGQKSLITVFGGRIFWEIWGQSLEATQEQPRASIFWDIKCGSRNRTCVSHTGAKSASTFDIRDNRNFYPEKKEKNDKNRRLVNEKTSKTVGS